MTEVSANLVYIKDTSGNLSIPYVNPATGYYLGVVKPDMDSISITPEGTISCDAANKSLSNLSILGNNRLQFAPFAVNSGTVINGVNHTLRSGSFIQSYYTPGTYVIELTDEGNYEVEMCGGGGGWSVYTAYSTTLENTGGSGAYFKGVVTLPIGIHTVKVGAGYTRSTGHPLSGGDSGIENLIIAGGGEGGAYAVSAAGGGAGGIVTIDSSVTVVSTSVSRNGNAGTYAYNAGNGWPYLYGGASVYDDTYSGYGAGSGYANDKPHDGFFKITKLTGDAAIISCDPCVVTTASGKTVYILESTSYNTSSENDGSYYIFRDCNTGYISLIETFVISATEPDNPSNGDYWLNISMAPAVLGIYNSELGEYQERDNMVWVGTCVISGGGITSLKNRYFNTTPQYRYGICNYKNGNSWCAVYSDGWCEQGGICTLNVEVTLLKTFVDDSYSLSVSASSKSASAFTPSASGTWYACGYLFGFI